MPPGRTTSHRQIGSESEGDSNMSTDSVKRKLPLRTIKKAKINDDPLNNESVNTSTSQSD